MINTKILFVIYSWGKSMFNPTNSNFDNPLLYCCKMMTNVISSWRLVIKFKQKHMESHTLAWPTYNGKGNFSVQILMPSNSQNSNISENVLNHITQEAVVPKETRTFWGECFALQKRSCKHVCDNVDRGLSILRNEELKCKWIEIWGIKINLNLKF